MIELLQQRLARYPTEGAEFMSKLGRSRKAKGVANYTEKGIIGS